jgi:UDP-N-acetylglucosamine 2-epimerase (non-hydrolysing)
MTRRLQIMTVFGTRPEVIKLAPVLAALEDEPSTFQTFNVATAQHTDLLYPFVKLFELRVDRDLQAMRPGQSLNELLARLLTALDPILIEQRPDLVLVQGDTTSALAGALTAFQRKIPVGHIEAGLRSGDPLSPFPEEMNRRLISRLATHHFAATARNRDTLLSEGVPAERVFLVGNPVVDALEWVLQRADVSSSLAALLESTRGFKRLALTTHRRENFGDVMSGHLRAIRDFVERHSDVVLIFPVHPNPAVRETAAAVLGGVERVHLIEPLGYVDFVHLLSASWLIASDSGGVQEEAPSLRKPLIVLRSNTERPEAIESGFARLSGDNPNHLLDLLQFAHRGTTHWGQQLGENPFGRGDSGRRIVRIIDQIFNGEAS